MRGVPDQYKTSLPLEIRPRGQVWLVGALLVGGGVILMGLAAAGLLAQDAAGWRVLGLAIVGYGLVMAGAYRLFRTPHSYILAKERVEIRYLLGARVYLVCDLQDIRLGGRSSYNRVLLYLQLAFANGQRIQIQEHTIDYPLELLREALEACYIRREEYDAQRGEQLSPWGVPWTGLGRRQVPLPVRPPWWRRWLPAGAVGTAGGFLLILGLMEILGMLIVGGYLFISGAGLLYRREEIKSSPHRPSWSAAPKPLPRVTLPPAVTDLKKLDQAETLYREGEAALGDEAWQEAIATFDQALRLDPRHAGAYNLHGVAYLGLSEESDIEESLKYNDLAIVDFTWAIAADPAWWQPYANRAYSYKERAAFEPLRKNREQWTALALTDYARVLELSPGQDWLRCERAVLYLAIDENCAQALADVPLCDPPDRAWLTSAACRCQGDYTQALAVIQEALSATPDDPWLLHERGAVYIGLNEYAKASADFEAAIKHWEDDFPPPWLWLGRVEAEYYLGHFSRAKEYIGKATEQSWNDWGAPYYYLGAIYLKEGRRQEAIKAFEWAEQTLDAGDPLLEKAQAELEKLGR